MKSNGGSMKNTLKIEYNDVSKRYEVCTAEGKELGRVYASRGKYEVYLHNKFIGMVNNPYSAKGLIFDTLHPDEPGKREARKKERALARAEKERQRDIKRQQMESENKAIIEAMNVLRENEAFRKAFSAAVKTVFPEIKDESNDTIYKNWYIMMNGIALHLLGGKEEYTKAIGRNDKEGKVLKLMIDNGVLAQIGGFQ
jgi:hypothetical protein